MNMASCLSASTKLMAAPVTHMITTLYTLIPTYLLSFNAGILTCLVSHAKKAPNIYNIGKSIIFLVFNFPIFSSHINAENCTKHLETNNSSFRLFFLALLYTEEIITLLYKNYLINDNYIKVCSKIIDVRVLFTSTY